MKNLNQMLFKIIITLVLFSSIFACSTSPKYSQKSDDTRSCNALSYGNKNLDVQSMDGVYKTCMNSKKNIRNKQSKKEKNLAIIDFFLSIFLPSERGG